MKKEHFVLVAALFFFLVIFTACANDNYSGDSNQAAYESANNAASSEAEMDTDGSSAVDTTSQQSRMVIYNGEMSIEVEDYNGTVEFIQREIDQIDGYIVESSVYEVGEDEGKQGTLVVRVPEEHFQTFLDDVEAESVQLLHKSTEGNDVTEEFVDLQSRLSSQEAVEERLLSFLEGADTTEDLLRISDDLAAVQVEIEKIKGRMNYLENHVALSTVTIYIEESTIFITSMQNRESLNTWQHAQSLFVDTINSILSFLSKGAVLIIGLSPIIAILGIVSFLIYWLRKRKRI